MSTNTALAEDVLATVGSTSVTPPYAQRVGFNLAIVVGVAITLVVAALLFFVFQSYPQPPLPALVAESDAKAAIAVETYQQLGNSVIQHALELFKTIVAQALLPVFTALLGYIFAKETNGSA